MAMRIPAARSPLPAEIPGRFFLLVYDRDRDYYLLTVDDAEHSSYNLGSDVMKASLRFRCWGLEKIGNDALNTAREFGAVQVIPSQDRVIVLRSEQPVKLRFPDDGETNAPAHLPDPV